MDFTVRASGAVRSRPRPPFLQPGLPRASVASCRSVCLTDPPCPLVLTSVDRDAEEKWLFHRKFMAFSESQKLVPSYT